MIERVAAADRRVRLLHLEDSLIDAELVAEYLRLDGLDVAIERVSGRAEYLEALERAASAFDLVLADYALPAFDGLSALELFRARNVDLPFIFVSGTLGEEIAIEALKRGATDYVLKQRLTRLPSAVARALSEAQERRRRREAEEELRRFNAQLERTIEERTAELVQLQKMESIGQLTGGIAHDFNNLLTPVMAALDLLERRYGDDASSQRLIAGALQAAERAKTLVQRLLAFARRQRLEARAVNVALLLEGLGDLLRRSLGAERTIELKAAVGLPAALVDPSQLEIAVVNLAVNARDATGEGGRIEIAAELATIADDTHPAKLPPGDYVVVSVIDDGEGMNAEVLRRCIEPFFSTKGVGNGAGLGLSMAHGLAAQSGGALRIDSAPGAGTRAALWLPAATVAPTSPHTPDPAPAGEPLAPLKILLVDDEAVVRSSAEAMLADMGHDVIAVAGGAEAIARLSEQLFDIVVTDYAMPEVNGAAVVAAAAALQPPVPALLMTGYADAPDACAGAAPCISKPFRRAHLQQGLRAALGLDRP